MACLDTSALLDVVGSTGRSARRAARARVRELRAAGDVLLTTRFNVAELLVGVARSNDPERERGKIEALLRPLGVLEFEARAAEVFGRMVARLMARGRTIGDLDALIASVCLANGQAIVTGNVRHFSRVPGLEVVGY